MNATDPAKVKNNKNNVIPIRNLTKVVPLFPDFILHIFAIQTMMNTPITTPTIAIVIMAGLCIYSVDSMCIGLSL